MLHCGTGQGGRLEEGEMGELQKHLLRQKVDKFEGQGDGCNKGFRQRG